MADSSNITFPPGAAGNTYSDDPMEYVYLGLPLTDPRTPGVCTVSITDREQKVDEKKAAGATGGRLTTHGIKPGKVQIRVTIWTAEQDRALTTLKRETAPDTNKKELPCFDVDHPAFRFHGVKAVQVLGWRGPEPGPIPHSWTFTMDCREYLPLGKKTVTKSDEAPSSNNALTKNDHPTPGSNPANVAP